MLNSPAWIGDRDREPGEDQVGGVVERVADRLAIAEGAVDQGLDRLQRALAEQRRTTSPETSERERQG